MKVLLVSPNIETLPDPVFPIGMACISAALKEKRIPVQMLDLCFSSDYEADITTTLGAYDPDVIGISLRNVDNVSYPQYISYLPFYRKIVDLIRKQCSAVIVVGGSGFTLLPEAILNFLEADYGVAGEGESSFVGLVADLEASRAPEKRILHPGLEATDLDALPFADREGIDGLAYQTKGGMGNIQTKRGCPFTCIYCTYPLIEGKRVRMRDPDKICDEMEQLSAEGIRNLFIVDNEFNFPPEHALAVCRRMAARKIRMRWGCYANPAFITDELVSAMKACGCTGLEFGCDSAHPQVLKNLGKNFSVEDMLSAASVCRGHKLPFCISLLLGGPGETMQTVRQTLETVRDMNPTAVICMAGVRIFPQTRMYHIALEEGVIDAGTDFLKPVFYLSPDVQDTIMPFLAEFALENPTWIFPGLQININENLQKKLRRFGIRGPLWEYMKMGSRLRGRCWCRNKGARGTAVNSEW